MNKTSNPRDRKEAQEPVDQNGKGIQTLDKVSLLLEAGTGPETMNLTAEPENFQFIFGLGTAGLTPFEYQIADKKLGEEITIEISLKKMNEIFQHHLPLPIKIAHQEERFFLKAKIIGVTKAEPREVIKSMAEIAECGDQCCGH